MDEWLTKENKEKFEKNKRKIIKAIKKALKNK